MTADILIFFCETYLMNPFLETREKRNHVKEQWSLVGRQASQGKH